MLASGRVLIAAAWIAAVLATQAWPSWQTGIREEYARDVVSYEAFAAAAPGLPDERWGEQHAQRFAPHWLVGTVADAVGVSLHDAYRAATAATLLATIALVGLAIGRRGPWTTWVLAFGCLIASAYPMRYLLAAPGMLGDAVFLLGLAACLLGVSRRSVSFATAGLLVAVAGRQTAVPVALAVAACVAIVPQRSGFRRRDALPLVLLPVAGFAVLRVLSASFSEDNVPGLADFTLLGALDEPRSLASHVGRTVLPLLVPGTILAAAWLRRAGPLPLVPLVAAAAVVVQPLLLNPGWVANNEPRLAALCLPAVAVAVGLLLSGVRLGTWETVAAAAGLFLASLHHRYTWIGAGGTATWLALVLVGTACAATLFVPLRHRGRPSSVSFERV